jgi:hypothetical protein
MEVVAQRDDYLVIMEDDRDNGFIYEMGAEERGPSMNLDAILARGYWVSPNREFTKDYLKRVSSLPMMQD